MGAGFFLLRFSVLSNIVVPLPSHLREGSTKLSGQVYCHFLLNSVLKEHIKEKKKPDFNYIPANLLILWNFNQKLKENVQALNITTVTPPNSPPPSFTPFSQSFSPI